MASAYRRTPSMSPKQKMSTSQPKHHHERSKVAIDRPKYREGNRDRAVKVFTINQESVYILIHGVPDINITRELLELCSLYGSIDEYRILDDYPTEPFTKVYWIKYQELQAARFAKRKIDDRSFYGGMLHVCYAPEYETVSDTRLKLKERRKAVARRLRQIEKDNYTEKANQLKDKISAAACSTSSDPEHSEKNNTVEYEVNSDGKFSIESKQNVEGSGFPALPDPPRQLPFEKWKHSSGSDDSIPKVPSAHSTLPHNFNPYPVGYRPPCPPQKRIQGPRLPEQNQSMSWQYEQSKHMRPDLHLQSIGNAGVHSQALRLNTSDVTRQNSKLRTESLVPRQVQESRKRTSAQANLSNTPNEQGKRLHSEQATAPTRTGITFYRQNKTVADRRPSLSSELSDKSSSFDKTVTSIRNKMKMVSQAPHIESPASTSSDSERIRI
ncbi:uncharacterized protein LOC117112714 [Anneissia japonica]|uniref:uncharacterized protein LOC117112714 n=1 Tax=Anneissia japonica TaxID=1529436 RepID=UPI0014255AFD|nr:uncharacterized protein LOC117112714 [Anneissia japonica]